jgi:hypothetical protein
MVIVRKLSRHLAIPIGLAALLLIGLVAMLNHSRQNTAVLYIKDHSGNRSAIEPIVVSGDISDRYASTRFEIKNGELTKHSEVYDPPVLIPDHYKYVPGMKKRIDGLDYEVRGEYAYYVTYQDSNPLNNGIIGKSSLVNTAIVNLNNTYSNALENGLAKIGEHMYFTVPTTADSTGANGIYELSFAEDGTTRTVAEYSLDQNKEGNSLIVLGLASAGDKLALIMKENGHVVVRGYDPNNGQMIGQMVLDQLDNVYSDQYEAFSNNQVLNLVFQKTSVSDYDIRTHKSVWSIDFHNGMRLIDQTNLDYENNWHDNFRSRMAVHYLDGRLYVMCTSTEPRTDEQQFLDSFRPIHLLIRVYQANELLYEGEIMSDLNDDRTNTINLPEGQSFDLQPYEYRMYDHLQLQARGEE